MIRSVFRRAVVWFSVAAVLAGCTAAPALRQPSRGSGSLQVTAVVPQGSISDFVHNGYEFELTLSQDNQTRTFKRPLEQGALTFSVDNLFAGVWSATLHLKDSEGDITHAASGEIIILPDEVATTEFVLTPEPGELEVVIDLSSIADSALQARIQGARVYVSPGGYSTGHRDPDGGTIVIKRSLQPQSYDYQVILYSDGFLAGNREYSSPWAPVDISPGKTTRILWTPSVGELDLRGTVLDAPAPPAALQGEYLDEGLVRLSWVSPPFPPDAEMTGIRIYRRDGIFGAYALVDEVPAEAESWETAVETSKEQRLAFAVTAFAVYAAAPDTVFESPRSSAVELWIPSER